MKVDFATAQQFMQRMEDFGIVGPARGSRAREVLAGVDGLPALLTAVTAPTGDH
ncbi:hypothetical protein [Nonomuraea sp. NPDC050786]|uniref:hypothetical protein n=1 Tax=Nonomuraea sp. NPDC050786 TaxID=3154840 RepID=UPI0033CD83B8